MEVSDTTMIFVLGGAVILLAGLFIYQEFRLRRLLRGKDAKTLEGTITEIIRELEELIGFRKEIENYLTKVEKRLKRSIQGTSTVRFNPFKNSDTGSNQSFATAFLDENGTGVVVSSLYSRDRVSVFSKPIKSFSSEYELTGEEKMAVEKSRPEKIA